MRKNGFTLIELLAVIVILAIIALIATPIILGIINDAREESNERSLELYASAVRNAIAAYQLTGKGLPKTFGDLDVSFHGNVKCEEEILYEDGSFYIDGCKANGTPVDYTYGKRKCELQENIDGNGTNEVKCGTENFYVIENKDNKITMLAKYNLNVGDYSNSEYPLLLQNSNVYGNMGVANIYGQVPFSDDMYWVTSTGGPTIMKPEFGSTYPVFIYNENSNLYKYVSEYEKYLKEELNVNISGATIMSVKQANDLGCNNYGSCDSAPVWLYESSYWLGDVVDSENLQSVAGIQGHVDSESGTLSGSIQSYTFTHIEGPQYNLYGVRPLIIISTSEVQ